MSHTRWAVAIQSKQISQDLELSTAICRCLEQLGHRAFLVEDGDPAGFEADVLLLLTNLDNFRMYCHRLKNCGTRRPVIILWQMDPLPPEKLPPAAEVAGLKAARWRDRFQLNQCGGAMPRWKKLCTLLRLREWASKQCSAPGYRKASRLMQGSLGEEVNWVQVRGVMESWRMIRDSQREGWIDHLAVSTNQRRRFLASRGITAHFIPVGAHAAMGRDLGRERDIPVGFLGAVRYGRRAAILERLKGRLAEKGIRLSQKDNGCFGEERCEWLNRTRILVSLHHYSWNPAWIRFLLAASCGTLVVSEPMNDEHPMKAGIHYIAATAEEMPEVIAKLLDDPERICHVTSEAARLCRSDLTLLHAMEELCRLTQTAKPETPCRK